MILKEYLDRVVEECDKHPYYRVGQAMFNVLRAMEPELAEEIRSSDADPFYATTKADPRVVKFSEAIRAHCTKE